MASKKAFKSQASSSRALSGALGGFAEASRNESFGAPNASQLSHVYEPPDLAGLSDPQVVVLMKNLQKKDSTTKSKALDDLQIYLRSLQDDPGESFLEAWIKVFPRLSIDNSRRVRQLAHGLQGQIAARYGKRIVRHVPKVIGAWIAGVFDSDRSVSKSAQDSFKLAFTSEEKLNGVWKIYQTEIAIFCQDFFEGESPTTLSDERSTSPDDAYNKFSRTLAATILILAHLIEKFSSDLAKCDTILNEILQSEKLWKHASNSDPFVRRASYKLLLICTVKRKDSLDPKLLSSNILTSALHVRQVGSALDYTKAVAKLSLMLPSIWTDDYQGTGKRSARARFCHFLKSGSQKSPPEYWVYVGEIIRNMPSGLILTDTTNDARTDDPKSKLPALTILEALHLGVSNPEEPRINAAAAWTTYLDACEYICSLSEDSVKSHVVEENVQPIVRQYIQPSSNSSSWSISAPKPGDICLLACLVAIRHYEASFIELWSTLSSKFIESMKLSSPEQSNDYKRSQDDLTANAQRWYGLHSPILENKEIPPIVKSTLIESFNLELGAATSTLQSRNGKPYGIASTLKTAIELLPENIMRDAPVKSQLQTYVNELAPQLVSSPSAEYVVRSIDLLRDVCNTEEFFNRSMDILEHEVRPPDNKGSIAFRYMFASRQIGSEPRLMVMASSAMPLALSNNTPGRWNVVNTIFSNLETPKHIIDGMLGSLTSKLSLDEDYEIALSGLERLRTSNLDALQKYAASTQGSSLLAKLLTISEYTDDASARRALDLEGILQDRSARAGNIASSNDPYLALITESFSNIAEDSISTAMLTTQATSIFNNTPNPQKISVARQLIPDQGQWAAALTPFLSRHPEGSLAACAPFGSAICLIDDVKPSSTDVARDAEGQSLLYRMARYISKMVETDEYLNMLAEDQQVDIAVKLLLILELVNDDLSVPGLLPLCFLDQTDNAVVDFVATVQTQMSGWLLGQTSNDFNDDVRQRLLSDSYGVSAASYYHGRALVRLASILESGMGRSEHTVIEQTKDIVTQPDVFKFAALLSATNNTTELQRLCNEMLAYITGQDLSTDQDRILRSLTLFSCILSREMDLTKAIPQQRTVFFIKHVVKSMAACSRACQTELLRVLQALLPSISDIYGSFWDELLDQLSKLLHLAQNDENLPLLASSFRMCELLGRLSTQESNEDLTDSWTAHKVAFSTSFIRILVERKAAADFTIDHPDRSHQPRRIVNGILRRLVTRSVENISTSTEKMYGVMASESESLQSAAYDILSKHIPAQQEDVSLEKALDKSFVAKLPEELLSLVIGPPAIDDVLEEKQRTVIALSVRSYLLSWKLVLLHWEKASYAVQTDYSSCLLEGKYVPDVMDLVVHSLITSRHKPLDPSGVSIKDYELDSGQDPYKDLGNYMAHIYCLLLLRLPSPSKSWWRNSTSRQDSTAIESWTEKHISPIVMNTELTAVRDWASSQVTTSDGPLTVKVSQNTKEITASVPVDERTTSISIRLPPSYPLARAEVTGVQRVGVAENKWQSWIRNAQGQLTVSEGGSNALIDCLLAWRRNVTAAMKGQTECSICYSVVGADKTLPKKECPTCKNRFHAGCLFRWFKSSNSSSCPLCRNTFAYS